MDTVTGDSGEQSLDRQEQTGTDTVPNLIRPARLLHRAALANPAKTSLVGPLGRLTLRQVDDLAKRLANYLGSRLTKAGERVMVVSPNSEYHLITWIACDIIGAIFVPVSFRLAPPEMRAIIDDCHPGLIITGTAEAALIDAALPKATASGIETVTIPQLHKALSDYRPRHQLTPVTDTETAAIVYTSGTSGQPRGACHSRATMWWAWQNYRDCFDYANHDTVMALAPLSHIGGFNGTTNDIFCHGGKVVIFDHFDPAKIVTAINAEKVTIGFAVPTVYAALLDEIDRRRLSTPPCSRKRGVRSADHPGQAYRDGNDRAPSTVLEPAFPSLRRALIGGAPLPGAIADRMARHQMQVIHVWGMTETGGAGCCTVPRQTCMYPESAGWPFTYSDIAIVDDNNEPIKTANIIGQVTIGGPHVITHYWPNKAAATVRGRLVTGDMASWTEDGRLMFVGRLADTIISGGMKIQPAGVEAVLKSIPGIDDALVVGIPDPYWGQTVGAIYVGNGATISPAETAIGSVKVESAKVEEESAKAEVESAKAEVESAKAATAAVDPDQQLLDQYCRARLAGYKVPRHYLKVKAIPRNANGKPDRRAAIRLIQGEKEATA